MTPEQKEAKRLVTDFENILPEIEVYNYEENVRQPQRVEPYFKKDTETAKQCALKCVDEKLNEYEKLISIMPKNGVSPQIAARSIFNVRVKQEITKL